MSTNALVAGAFARLSAVNFRGAARRIADIDLPTIGARIGVGEDELHAILEVESSGCGFDDFGRPKMLFEPHVFFRNLEGAERDQAVKAGLAYKDWKPGAYPKDSYPRLVQAMAINATAALRSSSWGLTQILGENHAAAGFPSPQAMVAAFADDEAAQLDATVSLIEHMGLAGALRARDWPKVAKGWNGTQYAKHGYDRKLKAAFDKWAKIPDTPFPARQGAAAGGKAKPAPLPAIAPLNPVASLNGWLGALFGAGRTSAKR